MERGGQSSPARLPSGGIKIGILPGSQGVRVETCCCSSLDLRGYGRKSPRGILYPGAKLAYLDSLSFGLKQRLSEAPSWFAHTFGVTMPLE